MKKSSSRNSASTSTSSGPKRSLLWGTGSTSCWNVRETCANECRSQIQRWQAKEPGVDVWKVWKGSWGKIKIVKLRWVLLSDPAKLNIVKGSASTCLSTWYLTILTKLNQQQPGIFLKWRSRLGCDWFFKKYWPLRGLKKHLRKNWWRNTVMIGLKFLQNDQSTLTQTTSQT